MLIALGATACGFDKGDLPAPMRRSTIDGHYVGCPKDIWTPSVDLALRAAWMKCALCLEIEDVQVVEDDAWQRRARTANACTVRVIYLPQFDERLCTGRTRRATWRARTHDEQRIHDAACQ